MEPADVVVMFVAVLAKSKRSNRGIETITFRLELRVAKELSEFKGSC
jgi:hypothetical protein